MSHPLVSAAVAEQRRVRLCAELAQVGPMRPGSLVGRFRRCGKRQCHCAQPGDPGHGPSWSLTHAVAGRTVTRVIPAAAVDVTRRQLAEYRRFRDLVRAVVQASEQACEATLRDEGLASAASEKGGSAPRSRRPSLAKSRR